MTKKKGEFTVLRNIRAGMVIILLIYIGLIFQSKGDSDTPFADVQKAPKAETVEKAFIKSLK